MAALSNARHEPSRFTLAFRWVVFWYRFENVDPDGFSVSFLGGRLALSRFGNEKYRSKNAGKQFVLLVARRVWRF